MIRIDVDYEIKEDVTGSIKPSNDGKKFLFHSCMILLRGVWFSDIEYNGVTILYDDNAKLEYTGIGKDTKSNEKI